MRRALRSPTVRRRWRSTPVPDWAGSVYQPRYLRSARSSRKRRTSRVAASRIAWRVGPRVGNEARTARSRSGQAVMARSISASSRAIQHRRAGRGSPASPPRPPARRCRGCVFGISGMRTQRSHARQQARPLGSRFRQGTGPLSLAPRPRDFICAARSGNVVEAYRGQGEASP